MSMKLPIKQELMLSKIWGETQKLKRAGMCNLCVTFAQLGREFQDQTLMSLREKGFIFLSCNNEREQGVTLKQHLQDLTFAELKEQIRNK